MEQDESGLSLAIGGVLDPDDIDMAVVMCGETCRLEGGVGEITTELGFAGEHELAAAIRHVREVALAIDMLRHAARFAGTVGCVTALVEQSSAGRAADMLRRLGADAVIECPAYDRSAGREVARLEARCDAAIVPDAVRLLRDEGARDETIWVSPLVPAAEVF